MQPDHKCGRAGRKPGTIVEQVANQGEKIMDNKYPKNQVWFNKSLNMLQRKEQGEWHGATPMSLDEFIQKKFPGRQPVSGSVYRPMPRGEGGFTLTRRAWITLDDGTEINADPRLIEYALAKGAPVERPGFSDHTGRGQKILEYPI